MSGHSEIRAPDITLRDWFAGQAMIGLLTQDSDSVEVPYMVSVFQFVADAAYKYADAMIAASGRTGRNR
jgi:hypothetical protein